MRTQRLSWLYLLNGSALIVHEIDAAYWQEWQLFGLPGGPQLFLGLNLVLVILTLVGYRLLILQRSSGLIFSWLLVAGGLFAAVVHSYYLLHGSELFALPASLALLAIILVLSILQAVATARCHGRMFPSDHTV